MRILFRIGLKIWKCKLGVRGWPRIWQELRKEQDAKSIHPFAPRTRIAWQCPAIGAYSGMQWKEKKIDRSQDRNRGAPGPASCVLPSTVIKLPEIPARRLLGGCVKRKVDDLTFLRALSGRCTADCEYPCWGRTLRGSAEGRCLLDIPGARLGIRNIGPFARSLAQ